MPPKPSSFAVRPYIDRYYSGVKVDPVNNRYPRLMAWEFLYEYVWANDRPWKALIDNKSLDTTALHIGLYLANWGMYRGSTRLLQNSNLNLLRELAKVLFTGAGPRLFELTGDDFLSRNAAQVQANQELFDEVVANIRAVLWQDSTTDTLVSKILLGVWGCCPALDEFYKKGIRKVLPHAGVTSLTGKGLTVLMDYADGLPAGSFPVIKTQEQQLDYPIAKLLDMAFFQYGLYGNKLP